MGLLATTFAYAQREVKGTVMDAAGSPIPGASVTIVGTNRGTSTDGSGTFSLVVPNNGRISVSAVGKQDQTVSTGTLSTIVITMANSASGNLEEVIITTTLGRTAAKSQLGVATAQVKAKEITQGRSTNIAQGLTAKVSGASIQQTNSGVNQNTRIVLRGIRSLTGNNQPMLILDGVPIALSFFNSINPNDIQDVTILKSATSTAIYGPDGVNGAIVVTTKKGFVNRPTVTLSHSTQFETIAFLPQLQNEFGAGYGPDPLTGQGVFYADEQQSWGDRFDGSMRPLGDPDKSGFQRMQKYAYLPNEKKGFFDVGVTNQTDMSYSMGDFYVSGQNADIRGTVPGDELQRRALTFKGEKSYNRFKSIFNLRYTSTQSNITTANSQIYYGITGAPGNVPLSQYSDWRNDFFSSPEGYFTTYLGNQGVTPYFAKDVNRQKSFSDDIFGNIEFNYKASSWLDFVYRLSMATTNTQDRFTREAYLSTAFYAARSSGPSQINQAATLTDRNNNIKRFTNEIFANLNKTVGKFKFNSTVGYSFREIRRKFLSQGSPNLGQTTFFTIQNRLGEPTVSTINSKQRLDRVFGNLGFSYNKWFNILGTASYDRDSRLALTSPNPNDSKIDFFYPSVNTSILLHELFPAIKNDVVSYVQLRGAIGRTGNVNIDPYQNEQSFGLSPNFPYGNLAGYQSAIGGRTIVYPVGGLKPEFVNTKEAGIEVGLFKNKVVVEANYYNQKNTNQILDVQLSSTTGANVAVLNTADFVNKGFELDLKLNDIITAGDFRASISANYSRQSNKVLKLSEGINELGIGNYNFAVVGRPAFVLKAQDYNRDSATGKVIVGADGMPTFANGISELGTTLPTDIVGINLNLNWRNISIAIVGQYSGGNTIIADQLGQFLDDNGVSKRSASFGRRAFVFPNSVIADGTGKFVENTNVFTTNYGQNFYNKAINTDVISNYTASGAFWKLREVSLTYDFPASLFKKGLRGVSAGISGRNLFTWLPKSNQWTDPEFSSNGNNAFTGNAIGRSTAFNLPPTRFMGVNVTFNF